jgi:hypothetical protein
VGGLVDRTHGRWPWLAALGAVPATVALVARRERLREDIGWAFWAPLPVYFWHQTEEWVWPGGFLPWVNRDVLGADDDEYPITRTLGLIINTGGGWALATAGGLRGLRDPAIGAAVHAMLVANAAFHVAQSARFRRYTPGFATALLMLAPVGLAGLAAIARRAGARPVLAGAAVGLGASAAQVEMLRRRVKTAATA